MKNILQKMTIADVQQFVKSLTSKADVVDLIFKATGELKLRNLKDKKPLHR